MSLKEIILIITIELQKDFISFLINVFLQSKFLVIIDDQILLFLVKINYVDLLNSEAIGSDGGACFHSNLPERLLMKVTNNFSALYFRSRTFVTLHRLCVFKNLHADLAVRKLLIRMP